MAATLALDDRIVHREGISYAKESYFSKTFPCGFLQRCFFMKAKFDGSDDRLIAFVAALADLRKGPPVGLHELGVKMVPMGRFKLSRDGFDWSKEDPTDYISSLDDENGEGLMSISGYINRCLYEAGFDQCNSTRAIRFVIVRLIAEDQSLKIDLDKNDENSEFLCGILQRFYDMYNDDAKYEFLQNLKKGEKESAEKNKKGYIYLVHPAIAKDDIFKIGMTICPETQGVPRRVKDYGVESILVHLQPVPPDKARYIESVIIFHFKLHFQLVQGNEYFQGSCKKMIEIITDVIYGNLL